LIREEEFGRADLEILGVAKAPAITEPNPVKWPGLVGSPQPLTPFRKDPELPPLSGLGPAWFQRSLAASVHVR